MDVVCPKCSAHHRAEPPSSLRARGAVRFRCTHCGNVFKVEFPPTGNTIVPAEATLVPTTPPPAERGPLFTVRAAGEVYPTTELATLQRWILESRVKPEDQLSVDGERWEPAGDRAELMLFFAAAERLHSPLGSLPPRMLTLPPTAQPLAKQPAVATAAVVAPTPLAATAVEPDAQNAVESYLPGQDPADADEGQSYEPEVDAVEEFWSDRTAVSSDGPTLTDYPLPEEPVPAPGGIEDYPIAFEPDTQETTLLSILQERTEEIRKAPVPVRRSYPPRPSVALGTSSLLPGSPPAQASPTLAPEESDQSMHDMAAEFDMQGSAEEEDAVEDEQAPAGSRAAGILAVVIGLGVLGVLLAVGWRLSQDAPASEPVVASEPAAAPEAARPAPPPTVEEVAALVVAPADGAVLPADGAVIPPSPTEVAPSAVAPVVAPAPVPVIAPPAAPKPAPVAAAPKPAPVEVQPVAKAATEATTSGSTFSSASDATKKGWALANKGKYDGAYDLFSKALQKYRGDPSLLYGRGYSAEKTGNDVSAAADYCAAMNSKGADEGMKRELQSGLNRIHHSCAE